MYPEEDTHSSPVKVITETVEVEVYAPPSRNTIK